MSDVEKLVPVKEIDFLDQDPPIRGQNYACISFLPNGEVIRNKEVFMFKKFTTSFSVELATFFENTTERFKDDPSVVAMLKGLKDRYDFYFDESALEHEYEHFKKENSEKLEKEYFEKNDFQTSISGLKVRGMYDTFKEAQRRAEQIQSFDKLFHVFVGQVGCWLPWSPYPDDVQDQLYTETQLNTLMKKYKEGQDLKRELYDMRKNDIMAKIEMHPPNEVSTVTVETVTTDTIKTDTEVIGAITTSENADLSPMTDIPPYLDDGDVWTRRKEEDSQ
jgi:hypothetical protein